MEEAVRNLDGALDRRQQIEALLVAARAAVEEHKAAFKNVKGAPTIARKAKSQRLAAAVVHLERGFLPGEVAEIPQAPPGPLMASPPNLLMTTHRRTCGAQEMSAAAHQQFDGEVASAIVRPLSEHLWLLLRTLAW